MKFQKNHRPLVLCSIVLLAIVLFSANSISAQDSTETDALREKVSELLEADKYVEAIPLLEKLIIAEPEDADISFYYGFALLAKAQGLDDKEAGKKLRIRAKKAFLRAKELGSDQRILDALIDSIPQDGSYPGKFSKNPKADELMSAGEAAFTQGKYDEALKLYGEALKLDPTLYEAALFSGDMYFRKEDFPNAELWYQKAIKIDPYKETAYRYSASPLMRQKKYDQARERYIEAFIVEPYSRFATTGISQWAEATNTRLGHPRIDVPITESDEDGKPKTTISISPNEDGSIAWIGYTATRASWKDKEFAKNFPNEKQYRHTLKEEADAFRSVIRMAKELKQKGTKLNQQLEILLELDKKGLLEAYILMARPDQGIAQDYAAYLKTNRDKLRQYVVEYVIIDDEK